MARPYGVRMLMAGAALLLALGIAAFMFWRERLPVVRMANGVELRVAKVSVGTRHYFSEEKGWRRFATDFVPDRYLTRAGLTRSEFVRSHGSLVVWLTMFDAQSRANVPPKIARANIQFSEGRQSLGQVSAISSNVVQLEFPIYPRADRELKIGFLSEGQSTNLTLRNPQPEKLRNWQARPLPQTNSTDHMIVWLIDDSSHGVRVYGRDPQGGSVGWMQWRVEVEDTAGNWEQFIANGSQFREIVGRVYQAGPLKLTVKPVEYISAGFVTNRAAGMIQEMEINERAANLGIEKLFFLGREEYLFTNGIPKLHTGAPLGTNVTFAATNSANQWDVHIAARRPNLVAIYPASAGVASFEARLRERTRRGNGGDLYQSYRPPVDARSFPPARLLRQFDIPTFYSTNAIEAEIIARHRPVEFIISQEKR
ncbi:MAG TPA: hypothetical protein VI282_10800 [Verrucomicrobiae bacterium]